MRERAGGERERRRQGGTYEERDRVQTEKEGRRERQREGRRYRVRESVG